MAMDGADSFFYAGLAGGRKEIIDDLDEEVADLRGALSEWQQYAHQKEAEVENLVEVVKSWRRAAANTNTEAIYQEDALTLLGTTADQVYGKHGIDLKEKEVEAKEITRNAYIRDYGFDPYD